MTRCFKKIVVLTGAGISAESGVPVFRGPDGLWHGHRIEDVATHEAIERDPWGVNAFFNELRRFVEKIEPNPAHRALKTLEDQCGNDVLVVTQNVDPLHKRAGSTRVLPMHGELYSVSCNACGECFPFQDDVVESTLCPRCGREGHLRPDIVLFDEMPHHMETIMTALMTCDLFVAVGTSGFVYPAAGFVDSAAHAGAHTIEVNVAETQGSPAFAERLTGPAGRVVPELVEELIAARAAL